MPGPIPSIGRLDRVVQLFNLIALNSFGQGLDLTVSGSTVTGRGKEPDASKVDLREGLPGYRGLEQALFSMRSETNPSVKVHNFFGSSAQSFFVMWAS